MLKNDNNLQSVDSKASLNTFANNQDGFDSNSSSAELPKLKGKIVSFEGELEKLATKSSLKEVSDKKTESLFDDESSLDRLFNDSNAQAALAAMMFRVDNDNNLFSYGKKEAGENKAENQEVRSQDLDALKESIQNFDSEPIINLDKEKLSMKVEFPSLNDLKMVQVHYDPTARSIVAEMVTSKEAAAILQGQVAQLERNLAKHNIKLQSLKINATSGNSSNQDRSGQQQKQDPRQRG
jgi:hypothetical protein